MYVAEKNFKYKGLEIKKGEELSIRDFEDAFFADALKLENIKAMEKAENKAILTAKSKKEVK